MTLWTVPGTGYAQQIVNAGDGPTMVINRDETNQVYVGNDNSVASKNGTGDIDIIDPLSYIVYDGIKSKFAIAAVPSAQVQVDCVQGATNWAPSPAQAAQQISLLGLATETTQLNNHTQLGNVNFNISAGTNPLLAGTAPGVATKVDSISGQGGWPTSGLGTETSSQIIYDNILARESITPNPDFTNGSLNEWNTANATVTTVTGVGLPNGGNGAPRKWAAKLVPTGGLNPAISSLAANPCSPGDTIGLRCWAYLTSVTLQFAFYIQYMDSSGVTLGYHNLAVTNPAVTFPNAWVHAHATDTVPQTIGGGVPAFYQYAAFLIGTPAANTHTFYVANFTAHIGGVPGQASTAFDIAATGTPLLHGYNPIANAVSTNVAANAGTAQATWPITKPGYVIEIEAQFTSPVGTFTTPAALVAMQWQDAATGLIIDEQSWYVPVGANGNPNIVYGKGPTRGNQVTVFLKDYDVNQGINIKYSLSETTQHIARDDWRSFGINSWPANSGGYQASIAQLGPASLFPLNIVRNGLAVGVYYFIIPMYAGQVYLNYSHNLAQKDFLAVHALDPSFSVAAIQPIFGVNTPATNDPVGPYAINLPRMPCLLEIAIIGAAENINATLTSIEYAS